MMNKLFIASKNVNMEIFAKMLNAIAKKYDCYVRLNKEENSLSFLGDEDYWRHIAEEVMEMFFPKKDGASLGA